MVMVQKHTAITQVHNHLTHSIYAFISSVYGYLLHVFNNALTANRMPVEMR